MFCDEHGTADYCPTCTEIESNKRIAELESRELGYIQSLRELEAEKSKAWETCQLAVERGMKLEAKLARYEALIQKVGALAEWDNWPERHPLVYGALATHKGEE